METPINTTDTDLILDGDFIKSVDGKWFYGGHILTVYINNWSPLKERCLYTCVINCFGSRDVLGEFTTEGKALDYLKAVVAWWKGIKR